MLQWWEKLHQLLIPGRYLFIPLSVRYHKYPKNSDTQKMCCNHPKNSAMWIYYRICPTNADRMANSVDPEQSYCWPGSALFAQTCLPENLDSLRYLLTLLSVFTLECLLNFIEPVNAIGSVWLQIQGFGVRAPARPPNFLGDWTWNNFYCHSPPYADSRRAVVSYMYCESVCLKTD